MTSTTMLERTLTLASALLLTATATKSDGIPPGRLLTNTDLFNIMLEQSHPDHASHHRHLHSISDEQKSTLTRSSWLPISPDTHFLPNLALSPTLSRHLSQYDPSNPYSAEPFVDGMEYYEEEAQSWRKLGFIIDCQANDDEMYSQHSQHSGDQNVQVTETGCARYLIWAAYVNENYQGNGAAEYQYYDPYYQQWDQSACDDGSPCTKMDCHLSSTSFSLLGFFKHKMYDDWMEQLFKHQGICRWSDEDYAFMKNARKAWPQGCTASDTLTPNGKLLYYDLKPAYNGQITVAMYTDEECITEYYMSESQIEGVIGNIFANAGSQHSGDNGGGDYDFSGESLSQSLSRWNSAFDVWNICHSCVAHDLDNSDGQTYYGECYDDAYYYNKYGYGNDDKNAYYDAYNNYYGGNGGRRELQESCPKGNAYECYDDAGYTSVNQCMKFSAKTVMRTASFRDLAIANLQGTLTTNALAGYVDTRYEFHTKTKTNALTYTFLVSMSLLCLGSIYYLVQIIREASRSRNAPALTDRLV